MVSNKCLRHKFRLSNISQKCKCMKSSEIRNEIYVAELHFSFLLPNLSSQYSLDLCYDPYKAVQSSSTSSSYKYKELLEHWLISTFKNLFNIQFSLLLSWILLIKCSRWYFYWSNNFTLCTDTFTEVNDLSTTIIHHCKCNDISVHDAETVSCQKLEAKPRSYQLNVKLLTAAS